MTDQPARALRLDALHQLKTALDSAATPADFLAEADRIVTDPDNLLELPFSTGSPDPLTPGTPRTPARDADNAPLVYEFLGAVDRANASDRRLWTYLAFATYRDYMEQRWPLDADGWKNRVERRWLILNANRGTLVRHGIARLWWIAALTYDAARDHPLSRTTGDPFAYTRAALRNEDRVNAIFDRQAGAETGVVRAVLEFAAAEPDGVSDNVIRRIMKEITLVYGYRDISYLEAANLNEVISNAAS